MQGVVLFLHLYVGKFSDLFFNDKILERKFILNLLVGAQCGAEPQLGCCCVEMVLVCKW